MYSVEEPLRPGSPRAGVGAQVMGPRDEYIIQHSRNVAPFWAAPHDLELGSTFLAARGQEGACTLPRCAASIMLNTSYIFRPWRCDTRCRRAASVLSTLTRLVCRAISTSSTRAAMQRLEAP